MTRHKWSRILLVIGLVGMLIGAVDPLEGSALILPAAAIAAAGAFLGGSRHRKWLFRGFVLLAAGIAAMFAMSALGGIGGSTGRSMWWALILLPYPVGWIMELVGGVRTLRHPN